MGLTQLRKLFKKSNSLDRFLMALILIGSIVALISLFRGILIDRQVQVEYLKGGSIDNVQGVSKIFVDIEGSVIHPGVYELVDGSRIKDVLVMSGGLAETADREFCEKNINMAELIKDGQKIYIPSIVNTNTGHEYSEAMLSSKKVSINTATVAELDTLWGIGESRATSIVKSRPYQKLEDLVAKGVLTQSLLDKNRDLLTVY